jgi:hypothetical protein
MNASRCFQVWARLHESPIYREIAGGTSEKKMRDFFDVLRTAPYYDLIELRATDAPVPLARWERSEQNESAEWSPDLLPATVSNRLSRNEAV